MRHPADGVLRRLLDEPAGVAETDRRHVAGCAQCLDDLSAARSDADLVGAALAHDAPVDVDAAWRRLTTTASGPAPARPVATPRPRRLRAAARRPAAAAVAVALVLGGAGAAAAGGWFEAFRTERIAPVALASSDLVGLPDLSAYGELEVSGEPDLREVADAAAAAEATGLDVPEVGALPRGVTGAPTYQVGDQASATFTFDAVRATREAAANGTVLPPVPPGLDGSAVRLVAGPGVAQVWSSGSGAPALLVARATAPTAYSSGLPFPQVRDYLLSLPGLPADVAAQLRTFAADGTTLPLPVPAEDVASSSADVGGVPATVLEVRGGLLTAVVWVQDGVLTAVAGSLDRDEVLAVARGLR